MSRYTLPSTVCALLLFAPVTAPQEPKTVKEALARIAKIEGKVKFDKRKFVVAIDI